MDADRFDIFTRSLTTFGSRRTLAAALVGSLAVLGLAGPDDVAAAKSGTCKRKPGECEPCKKGKCERKNGKKCCKAGKIKAEAVGTPCRVGSCRDGSCVAAAGCPSGTNACAGGCVDTRTDPRNCGACGKRCAINQICSAGICTCPVPDARGICETASPRDDLLQPERDRNLRLHPRLWVHRPDHLYPRHRVSGQYDQLRRRCEHVQNVLPSHLHLRHRDRSVFGPVSARSATVKTEEAPGPGLRRRLRGALTT
jgi:hypothetical protein